MRIAIVNDLTLAVEALRRVVRSIPSASIAWVARDGREAIEMCGRDRPDLVLMDLIMPGVDGVEATRAIMQGSPCPVLVVTASVRGNVGKVYEALGNGAIDAVATPRLGLGGGLEGAAELVRRIETVRALARELPPPANARADEDARASTRTVERPQGALPLVAIGASTGGPRAIATVLAGLPADLPAAVAIVQHIDSSFAPGLALWLQRRTSLRVAPLVTATVLRPGHVWLASGDGHLVLRDDLRLDLAAEPRQSLHRPSIDVFFESIARHLPGRGCAVLLTGMGRDGAVGLLALRRAGYHTIAQDEQSSVVWGMPRIAIETGAAIEILPLEGIGARVAAYVATLAARPLPKEKER